MAALSGSGPGSGRGRQRRVEGLALARPGLEPLGRLEARAVLCGEPFTFGYESRQAQGVDEGQGAAGPGGEADAEYRAEIGVRRLHHHAGLDAARRLQRLDVEQAL